MAEANASTNGKEGVCKHCLSAPSWVGGFCPECDAKETLQKQALPDSN